MLGQVSPSFKTKIGNPLPTPSLCRSGKCASPSRYDAAWCTAMINDHDQCCVKEYGLCAGQVSRRSKAGAVEQAGPHQGAIKAWQCSFSERQSSAAWSCPRDCWTARFPQTAAALFAGCATALRVIDNSEHHWAASAAEPVT